MPGVDVRLQDPDIGQVTVTSREVEPVPDHEGVGNLEAEVVGVHVHAPPTRFVQERHYLDAGRIARAQVLQQIVQRQAGVDDIFYHQDVTAFDTFIQILEEIETQVTERSKESRVEEE